MDIAAPCCPQHTPANPRDDGARAGRGWRPQRTCGVRPVPPARRSSGWTRGGRRGAARPLCHSGLYEPRRAQDTAAPSGRVGTSGHCGGPRAAWRQHSVPPNRRRQDGAAGGQGHAPRNLRRHYRRDEQAEPRSSRRGGHGKVVRGGGIVVGTAAGLARRVGPHCTPRPHATGHCRECRAGAAGCVRRAGTPPL